MASPSGDLRHVSAGHLPILMIVYRQLHHLMIVKQAFAYIKKG